MLLDLPAVVAGAEALRSGPLAERCEIVGGSFFDGVPEGDLYLLKGIVHGFADRDAVRLLATCRRAIRPDGRLLIIETVPAAAHEPDPRKAFMDLMMLSLVPGRERSAAELRPLLAEAGFDLARVLPTPGPNSIVEARVTGPKAHRGGGCAPRSLGSGP